MTRVKRKSRGGETGATAHVGALKKVDALAPRQNNLYAPVAVKPIQDHTTKKKQNKDAKKGSHTEDTAAASNSKHARQESESDPIPAKKVKVASSSTTAPPSGAQPSPASNNPTTFTTPSTISNSILNTLEKTHTVTSISVLSSSKIESRVTRILTHLSTFDFTTTTPKPPLVLLAGKPGCASKLISIIEIAKREIANQGQKWYQYTSVESRNVEMKARSDEKKIVTIAGREVREDGEEEGGGEDDDEMGGLGGEETVEEETTAFETMKTPLERAIEGRPKVRAVPVMTTYLSRVRVESLKAAYGEQTNAPTV